MKKILITGADSYIGTSVEKWLGEYPVPAPAIFTGTVNFRRKRVSGHCKVTAFGW